MEEKVSSTLSGLEGELKGKFYPLTGMDKATQQQLIDVRRNDIINVKPLLTH